ncbi:MAG: molybdopterin-dependent oxidoreductase [Deltaproteobacteria bacterium]|nr:molybdopterin-dependent oxidoreductase [Deltaproteobacteria bacterium]MBW2363321.1 molybdopterin-dependent oxidoreductase [Deltaproteobacteria bacterium]
MSDTESPEGVVEHRSFCRICNAACGLTIRTSGQRVLSVRGDRQHPISEGYTCPKGRALAAFHHDERRLDHPLLGRGEQRRPAAWDEALGDLAGALSRVLEESGSSAIAGYLGTAIAFDSCGWWATGAFLDAVGSPQRYSCATLDTPAKPLVSELMTGFAGLHPVPDVESCRLLLLVGTNPVASHGHLSGLTNPVAKLRSIARRGEVWVVDPRRTQTARGATRHLAIRPGTDALLLAFLVRELLREGADADILARHASGVAELAEAVAPFDLARAARGTGLPQPEIQALLDAIRRHGRLVALSGTGSTMSASANVNEWLLWSLQVITGSFERPGGGWFNPGYVSRLDRIPSAGWRAGEAVAGPGPASRPELPRRNGEFPCAGLVDEIEAGNIRALFVPGGNPITAFPETVRTLEALRSLEVLVVGDVVQNEIVELATHVWPCTGQLERADLSGVMEFYRLEVAGQLARPVVRPVAERRPVWWCFAQLAARLGLGLLPDGVELDSTRDEDLLAALVGERADLDELARATQIVERPVGWVERNLLPEGRWRLAPAPLVEQLGALAQPPTLALLPGRQLRTMNSALRDVAASGERTDCVELHVSPEDADERGVRDGGRVRLRSASGELVATARIDDTLRRGAVWLPHGWTRPNVGRLTSSQRDIDPLTGMVLQSGVAVEIDPLDDR